MVLVTVLGSTMTVEAASSKTKEYDKKFKAYYNRLENEIYEQYDELTKEEKRIVTDMDVDYIKMGHGMYEILWTIEMYDDDVVMVDIIFDVLEEDGYVYLLLNNERIDDDELEELYPEINEIDMNIEM
jgi:hypothetical protein